MQNAAACLVTGMWSCDHITPVLQQLTGYQCNSEWNLNLLSWSTRGWTTSHHRICQTIASSLPSASAVSFDHETISSALLLVLVHVLEMELLPPLDHVFGTVFLHGITRTCPSTWFVIGRLAPQTENVFNCSRHQRLVTVAFRCCVQIFLLTYLLVCSDCDLTGWSVCLRVWSSSVVCSMTKSCAPSSAIWRRSRRGRFVTSLLASLRWQPFSTWSESERSRITGVPTRDLSHGDLLQQRSGRSSHSGQQQPAIVVVIIIKQNWNQFVLVVEATALKDKYQNFIRRFNVQIPSITFMSVGHLSQT